MRKITQRNRGRTKLERSHRETETGKERETDRDGDTERY